MGELDPTKCRHFTGGQDDETTTSPGSPSEDTSGQRLPWTGRALGLNDMSLVSARTSTELIGLVGPFKSGKTGLLTALFAHLAKAGSVGAFAFAGSFTLQGWQRLRDYTVWPSLQGPGFPPHTPDSGDRVPSLLHLAFRQGTGQIRDLLFTDAPGEWFTRWLRNQSSDDARGARWISDNATQLLFIADRVALAGQEVGKARRDILALARVISENRRNRPVIVAWTKSDLPFDVDVEKPIREKLVGFFGKHPTYDLSVKDPACTQLLEQLLVQRRILQPSSRLTQKASPSPFCAYHGVRP
jgi:hypothetical protein